METLLALVAIGGSIVTAQRVVPVGFSRPSPRLPALHRRAGTYSQELNNNLTSGGYYAQVAVGTPPQAVDLVVDTGSSDVWVLDRHADLCQSESMQDYYGYCLSTFDPSASSTFSIVSRDAFSISYVDGSGAEGDYVRDTLSIGGIDIENLQMGLAENSTINSGLLGIGFAANVAAQTPYPNIMTLFRAQDLIAVEVYSLYLNDRFAETGTILFGGLDTEKYIGRLGVVPILPDRTGNYSSFAVVLASLSSTAADGTVTNYARGAIPVILDSGTTLTYLPYSVAARVFRAFGAVDDTSGTGLVYVSCRYLEEAADLTLDFRFGGGAAAADNPVIRVPTDELVLDNVRAYQALGLVLPPLPFADVCTFGLHPDADYYLLGNTFLRSAYVVYDLTNREVALAQANVNSTRSNVIEITAADGIPDVPGVASQVPATPTPSAARPDGTATATATATADGPGGENAGLRAVPAPDWKAVVAMAAMVGLCALMGVEVVVL
ncbi:aspartic peptidase domain-containing protein [Durotheca rogersii]|uniref:aspartic peptidase domain-containing protein n=1 Tax=Durotheca rogersii TaxID=419775 RepID=UPI00221EF577|nr:aspartic peptidase domain-containing protein [Durotheca rogersii]KAI5867749.1 aspartic peptidase domain-containing protein [Durotheca rogersii]